MKYVDYKCPNCGGSIKCEKGSDIGTCENCGATLRARTEVTDKIFRAFDLISTGKFVSARELLEDALSVEVENGQAYLGLLLCDTECATPTALARTKYTFADNPNYKRALDFLSYDQRQELMVLCNQNQLYNKSQENQKVEATNLRIDLIREFEQLLNTTIEKTPGSIQKMAKWSSIWSSRPIMSWYLLADIQNASENEKVCYIYSITASHVEKVLTIYNSLSDEEKYSIIDFEPEAFEIAVDVYHKLKNVIEKMPAGKFEKMVKAYELRILSSLEAQTQMKSDPTLRKKWQELQGGSKKEKTDPNAGTDSKGSENKSSSNEKENDASVLNIDVTVDHKKQECTNQPVTELNCIEEYDNEIKALHYQLGSIGRSDRSKKTEIKNRLEQLELGREIFIIKERIAEEQSKLNENNQEIQKLNDVSTKLLAEIKGEIMSTPITSIKRKIDLKIEYKQKKEEYKNSLKLLNEKNKDLTKHIECLENQLTKLNKKYGGKQNGYKA